MSGGVEKPRCQIDSHGAMVVIQRMAIFYLRGLRTCRRRFSGQDVESGVCHDHEWDERKHLGEGVLKNSR